jgi:PleD family two-component response regulator
MGIAVYDAELDGSVDDTIRRADKIMYENKRVGKLE